MLDVIQVRGRVGRSAELGREVLPGVVLLIGVTQLTN